MLSFLCINILEEFLSARAQITNRYSLSNCDCQIMVIRLYGLIKVLRGWQMLACSRPRGCSEAIGYLKSKVTEKIRQT